MQRAFELTEGSKTSRFGQEENAFILRVDEVIEPFTPDLDDIRDELRAGVPRLQRQDLPLRERHVDHAAPRPKRHLAPRLLDQECAEVLVRAKQDRSVQRNRVDDCFRIRRRADHVALTVESTGDSRRSLDRDRYERVPALRHPVLD